MAKAAKIENRKENLYIQTHTLIHTYFALYHHDSGWLAPLNCFRKPIPTFLSPIIPTKRFCPTHVKVFEKFTCLGTKIRKVISEFFLNVRFGLLFVTGFGGEEIWMKVLLIFNFHKIYYLHLFLAYSHLNTLTPTDRRTHTHTHTEIERHRHIDTSNRDKLSFLEHQHWDKTGDTCSDWFTNITHKETQSLPDSQFSTWPDTDQKKAQNTHAHTQTHSHPLIPSHTYRQTQAHTHTHILDCCRIVIHNARGIFYTVSYIHFQA